MALHERDRKILDVERSWWLAGSSKSQIVRSEVGLSLTRYNQLLGELVDNPEAELYDPLLVRRLRRSREARRWAKMGVRPASGRRDR
jgi:hypothetical protein